MLIKEKVSELIGYFYCIKLKTLVFLCTMNTCLVVSITPLWTKGNHTKKNRDLICSLKLQE